MADLPLQAPPRTTGVTMDAVAERAGVSRATVSRTLAGRVPVSDETREKVLRAVNELGYVPNLAASTLAGGGRRRSGLVGLLLRDPRTPAYGHLHSELQRATDEVGLQLVTMAPSDGQGASFEKRTLERLLGLQVDGLFVATGVVRPEELTPFLSVVPVMSVGRMEWNPHVYAVSYDEDAHAGMLAALVAERGHRRVSVVIPAQDVSVAEHVRGTMIAARLRDRDVEVVEIPAPTFGWIGEQSSTVIDIVRKRRVTAAMFTSDRRALHFLDLARPAGLRVPEDVSVTGCDGILPGLGFVSLATLRLPIESVARRAVEVMHDMIASPGQVKPRHELQQGIIVNGGTLDVPRRKPRG